MIHDDNPAIYKIFTLYIGTRIQCTIHYAYYISSNNCKSNKKQF